MKDQKLKNQVTKLMDEQRTVLMQHGCFFPSYYLQLRTSLQVNNILNSNNHLEHLAALVEKGTLSEINDGLQFRIEFTNLDDAKVLQAEFFKRNVTNSQMPKYPKKINVIIDENGVDADRYYINFNDRDWRKAIAYEPSVLETSCVNEEASAPSLRM